MNDRIKELVEIAERNLHDRTGQTWGIHPVIAQEFAELIVKECIDNLSWHGHDDAVKQLYWLSGNKLGMKL